MENNGFREYFWLENVLNVVQTVAPRRTYEFPVSNLYMYVLLLAYLTPEKLTIDDDDQSWMVRVNSCQLAI